MALHRGTVASSISFKPSAVTSLSLTASDRTITATWSAPTDNGGSPITSYTVETQLNSEGWVSQGTQSSGVSFTVRNNTVVTARSYQVRVTANNAVGAGTSATSNTATPSFGTPATPTLAMTAGYPSTSSPNDRPFTVTYSPLACSGFANTETYIYFSGWSPSTSINDGVYANTTSSTANQIWSVTSTTTYGYYNPGPSETYYAFTRTYNSDGDYVDSATGSFTTTAQQSYQYYSESTTTYTSSTVAVNSNTYSITSAYVGGPDRRTNSITCYAWSTTGTATICTSSRYFSIAFSNNTTGTYTNESQLVAPFTTNSGQTPRSRTTAFSLGYGGGANTARIQIRGAGSTVSGWNPTISVYFVVNYTDRTLLTAYY